MKRVIVTLTGIAALALACGEGDSEETTTETDQVEISVEQDGKAVDLTAGEDGTKVKVEGTEAGPVEARTTDDGASTGGIRPKAGKHPGKRRPQ